MQRRFYDLFIASFAALFFEMLLVRWLPTTIYYLGYFKNCILFATFLGFGCGLATARRVHRAIPYFTLCIAVMVLGARMTEHFMRIMPPGTGEFLWPQPKLATIVAVPMMVLLAVVFVACSLLMLPLGRVVGIHLSAFPPITAYTVNISASLLGVVSFMGISYLSFGPVVWFTIATLPILYLARGDRRAILWNVVGLLFIIGMFQAFYISHESWSPYSKISLGAPHPVINARQLLTNNNGHQILYDLSNARLAKRPDGPDDLWNLVRDHVYIYESAYHIVQPRSVLIVGGGTGNEAAAALRHGVGRIDVVEIDPVIIRIGRTFHPEAPYSDSRVRIINDDARHYMATTRERYDLIIFGFLDSTSYLSSMSNIRLDNYVYTVESFQQARSLLNPGGLLQVTYYALANFVRFRIFSMLQTAFEHPPLMTELRDGPRGDVIFFAGPAAWARSEGVLSSAGLKVETDAQQYLALAPLAMPVTDDWPYLNVLGRSIGGDYLLGLATMIVISFLFIRFFLWQRGVSSAISAASWCFFLQGAGFMLLETNTITRMALILGSTWIVTSFAVILVLLAGLISNLIVQRFASPSIFTTIGLIAISIILNYLVDVHHYLALSGLFAVPLAAFQVYLPMLGSSMLFARLFQGSEKSGRDLGMNMLGALFGGMSEYISLIVGIQAVYLLSLIVFLAIIPTYHSRRAPIPGRDSGSELEWKRASL